MKKRKYAPQEHGTAQSTAPESSPATVLDNTPTTFRVSAEPARIRRAPDPQTSTTTTAPTAEETAALKAKIQADLTTGLAGISGIQYKQKWDNIRSAITSMKGKKKDLPKEFQFLLESPTKDELAKLSEADRESIAATLENTVIKGLTGLNSADLTTEYDALPDAIRGNIESGKNGYIGIRTPLFNTFGNLDGMKAYYADMKSANFPSAGSAAKGRYTLVHKNLKDRLDKAITLMKSKKTGDKTWFEIMEAGIKGVGGFNIRENRNKPSALSDHSFGWAIDIDAPMNPNFGSINEQMVSAVSGIDIDKGTSVENIRKGGNAESLLPDIEKLKAGSEQFKTVFSDDAHFKTEFLKQLSNAGLTLDDAAYTAYTDLITKNNDSKGLHEHLKKLHLAQHFDKESKDFATKVGPLAQLLISTYDEAVLKKEKSAVIEAGLTAQLAVVGLVPGKSDMKALTTLLKSKAKDKSTQVEALLNKMFFTKNTADFKASEVADVTHKMYLTYREVDGKQSTTSAQTEATHKSIAANGYLNLPGELIAALCGQDGGDLDWLGAAEGTKDYMHFQLKKSQRPPLVQAAQPATSATTSTADSTVAAPATVVQEKSMQPDPADALEQEAERMADQVTSDTLPFRVSADARNSVRRKP